jgi:hypothetical protein
VLRLIGSGRGIQSQAVEQQADDGTDTVKPVIAHINKTPFPGDRNSLLHRSSDAPQGIFTARMFQENDSRFAPR